MEFAVLGPGGVGGFLAALLVRSGNSVVVLAGEETARALDSSGLHLQSQRFGTFEVAVTTAQRLTAPVDACLVTVKATQLVGAMSRVPPDALGDGVVIPFLNGLEHVDTLRRIYGDARVVAATIRIETTRVRAGVIRHTSPFAIVDIAVSPSTRERVERIADALRETGIEVRIREDELAMLWDKFAFLAPLALITTRERAPAGAVKEKCRDEVVAMIGEFIGVAQAEGVALNGGRMVQFFDSLPPGMETSMQRDQQAGRPIELDALGGALLRRADAHGVDVPVTRRIVTELQARQAQPA